MDLRSAEQGEAQIVELYFEKYTNLLLALLPCSV